MADTESIPRHLRHGSVSVVCAVCLGHFKIQPSRAARTRVFCCSFRCRNENIRRHAIEKQFWGYVNKTETCWIWTGTIGRPTVRGADHGAAYITNRRISAHRFSYELHNGPIPDGLFVLHHCDVPRCVNPAHLYVGTQRQNMHDAIRRKRFVLPPFVRLADKTHCAQGHPTAEWLGTSISGKTYCRRCRQIHNAKRYKVSKFARQMSPTLAT